MDSMFDWKNKEELLRLVAKWPDIVSEEVVATLDYVGAVLVGKTSDLAPAGSGSAGGLHNSIHHNRPEPLPTGWIVTYGTTVEHAEVIENGRTPGSAMPPIEDIARWAYTKFSQLGIELKTFTKGERAGQTETDEEAATRVAWGIANSIAKNGFSSGPVAGDTGGTAWKMFARGIEEAKAETLSAFDDCKARIVHRINLAEAV